MNSFQNSRKNSGAQPRPKMTSLTLGGVVDREESVSKVVRGRTTFTILCFRLVEEMVVVLMRTMIVTNRGGFNIYFVNFLNNNEYGKSTIPAFGDVP